MRRGQKKKHSVRRNGYKTNTLIGIFRVNLMKNNK